MNKGLQIFLGMIFVCIAVWLQITTNNFIHPLIERLDNLSYDLQLRARALTSHEVPDKSIAIIDIDDKSLQKEGRWPWPRSRLSDLTNQLKSLGVSTVLFDMFFSEKQPNIADQLLLKLTQASSLEKTCFASIQSSEPLFDEDATFAKSIADNNALLSMIFLPTKQTENDLLPPLFQFTPEQQVQLGLPQAQGYITSIPVLQHAAKGNGFINVMPDNDGIVRRAMLITVYNGGVYPALSLQAVLNLFGDTLSLITPAYNKAARLEGLQLGKVSVHTDEKGRVLIPFIGKNHTFPYYSATDILQNKLPQDALLGKIVIVGTSAVGLGDVHPAAIENLFPGIEIQATLLNGLLQNNFAYIPAWAFGENLLLIILLGLLGAFIFPYAGPRTLSIIMVFFPVSLYFINHFIWDHSGIILSFLIPIIVIDMLALLNIILGYLFETRRREYLKELFGQYVPEKHIDEMLADKSSLSLQGEDRTMSVLFADIRNFTTISENMTAQDVVKMLNEYFTPMTEIIFKNEGTIDKYVGDMIMAFWGAPLNDVDHVSHAIESALDMGAKTDELSKKFQELNLPEIKIGIGINSGLMTVGDMGSHYRRNYTVLGDTVNLASRVEGLSKFYGVTVVVTEYSQQNQGSFVFRKLDKIRVKGRSAGLVIYEAVCKKSALTPELSDELTVFHAALDSYFNQRWKEAEEELLKLHQKYPQTKIYKIYLDRLKEFAANPVAADWDGIYVHTAK